MSFFNIVKNKFLIGAGVILFGLIVAVSLFPNAFSHGTTLGFSNPTAQTYTIVNTTTTNFLGPIKVNGTDVCLSDGTNCTTTPSVATSTATASFVYPVGSSANASIRLSGASNTGFYSTAAGNVGLTAGGTAITWDGTRLAPGSSNSRDLGTLGSAAFRNFYASGTAIIISGIGAPSVTDDVVCWEANGALRHQASNCTVSSERFKTHIASLSNTELLDRVRKLRAVEYDYKPEMGGKHDEGFIAEEVAAIDPYMVVWEEATNTEDIAHVQNAYPQAVLHKDGKTLIPRTVAYDHITVLLAGALQAEDERITALEKRVDLFQRVSNWIEKTLSK